MSNTPNTEIIVAHTTEADFVRFCKIVIGECARSICAKMDGGESIVSAADKTVAEIIEDFGTVIAGFVTEHPELVADEMSLIQARKVNR